MVIDTSAVLAILQRKPESERFAELIEADPIRLISAVSVLEARLLVERGGHRRKSDWRFR